MAGRKPPTQPHFASRLWPGLVVIGEESGYWVSCRACAEFRGCCRALSDLSRILGNKLALPSESGYMPYGSRRIRLIDRSFARLISD
jgi:hypothetical protein